MTRSRRAGHSAPYWQKPRGVHVPVVGGLGQSVGSATGPEVPVYVHDFVHCTLDPIDAQRSYSPTHAGSLPPSAFVVPPPPPPLPPPPPPLPLPGVLIGFVQVTPNVPEPLSEPASESPPPLLLPLLEPLLDPELLPLPEPLLDPELLPLLDPLPEPLDPGGTSVGLEEEEQAPIANAANAESGKTPSRRILFMESAV